MVSITFRPLRRIKKTGKIVVASYSLWNRVRTADYNTFALTVDNEYAGLPADEHVYNHEGKPLFWKDFNPADIPVFDSMPIQDLFDVTAIHEEHRGFHAIRWQGSDRICYNVTGLDCMGTPTFSHNTIERVAEYFKNFHEYEPLTVGMVVKWFGWMLYQLQNADLQIGKP